MLIYHITQESDWLSAVELGYYDAPSLESEGFIHCSYREQVVATATRYYAGVHGLVLLEIDSEKLLSRWVEECSTGDELFPHVYGSIALSAIERVLPFEPGSDGKFILPAELS